MEDQIRNALTGPLMSEGIMIYDVHFGEEDGEKTLFVVVDSNEEEIDLNLCVKATELINPIIDMMGIEQDHVLDVSGRVKGSEE